MTRRDLALLLSPLPLSPLLLALAACGSDQERADRLRKEVPSPFWFEMAMAGPASGGDAGAVAPALASLTPPERAQRMAGRDVRPIDQPTAVNEAEGRLPARDNSGQPTGHR